MNNQLSLSVFTIETDRKPILAFAAKKHHEAEAFCSDERVRSKLRSLRSGGAPLCDDYSILRVRLARSFERARYREHAASRMAMGDLGVVFLIDVDNPTLAELTEQTRPAD